MTAEQPRTKQKSPPPKNETDFLKLSNPDSLESFLHGENTTTNTKVENPNLIKIIEIRDDGCVLALPDKTCAAGHFMLFKLRIKDLFEIEFTAKVIETETAKMEDGKSPHLNVALAFYQIDRVKWEKLLAVYQQRQMELSKIIASIKD